MPYNRTWQTRTSVISGIHEKEYPASSKKDQPCTKAQKRNPKQRTNAVIVRTFKIQYDRSLKSWKSRTSLTTNHFFGHTVSELVVVSGKDRKVKYRNSECGENEDVPIANWVGAAASRVRRKVAKHVKSRQVHHHARNRNKL